MIEKVIQGVKAKLPECIGILLIIPASEIGEMTLEDPMEYVSSPRKERDLLLFQYGSILYTHIEYHSGNGADASPIGKNESEFHIITTYS